jgi:hypothetical protein
MKIPESKVEIELLLALAGMWIQFCPDNFHQFLSVAENAEEILHEYGLLTDVKDKFPDFNDDLYYKLEAVLAPNQDLSSHLKLIYGESERYVKGKSLKYQAMNEMMDEE